MSTTPPDHYEEANRLLSMANSKLSVGKSPEDTQVAQTIVTAALTHAVLALVMDRRTRR